jgi:hypothetical protein
MKTKQKKVAKTVSTKKIKKAKQLKAKKSIDAQITKIFNNLINSK